MAVVWTVRDAADVVRELSYLDLQVPLHTTLNIHTYNYQRLYIHPCEAHSSHEEPLYMNRST